ncbi:acyl-CoA dehydrogenase [Legionella oakridgensis]|uniref:Acyl-coenzyme A dehydrogenase n=2 Tax=Legionella oakridgensis TaxID=29423 RepID=W0BB73_9GAMM|nr:acyl-CoA dehydrogenase [Legionella oakridgensis]AHE65946.1 acyl-CoA dehydrogenase [Legionella oakridgensis ATCC 33761 = DSM 21215]ETO94317.1 acyl-CoA dehydrogenase [Legionella oakridgensis RV-2-2007]KTD43796.1 acyl coenzyme A dehydrogenase [Legionella oakridgensis]STY15874.1 Acyl-CoA dehydrogenase [Legionella longbeachae]
MATLFFLLYLLFTLIVLYHALNPLVWEIGSAAYLLVATFFIGLPWVVGVFLWVVIIGIFLIIRVESIRNTISDFLYRHAEKSLPKLSKTEEEALNAGDTWLEKDIFMGTPDWNKLQHITTALSPEEQAFLDNETQTLCAMLDDWEISQHQDLPANVWEYLKEKGFFGLVIGKEYEGKGFSARAHSDVVIKIASRSGTAAVTVMVPNSLGPGELLQHYGTEEQKNYYLPRLAKGVDIPCFALTEPGAGSDATSIKSEAVVVEKVIQGKKILGLNLTLNKRWITLAPVATLIGLAVNLKDPHGLLQGEGKEGITCLLISRDAENLEIGNRHLPANQPFMNGTIRGENIFVPISSIIGGQKQAGHGWQMLVECLSIGRSISLPALGTASSAISYLTTGAFARIRQQFNVEIAQFEGVEEKLAEIAGLSYLVNATRLLTAAAVNEHKKPSVASAITKYFNTELARIVINDAMDVHAGRAVVVGPRNYMTSFYHGIPISVTVEGANIMSRNLLIFGQGSMACHPFIRQEFYALASGDKSAFKNIIWQHISYFMRNFAKTICSAWSGGFFISVPNSKLKKEYKRLARLSHAYAWLADLALIYLGGALKRKERLSARLADGMSYLYMAMAALQYARQYEAQTEQQMHARWAVSYCFYHAQKAMISFCHNFPSRVIGNLMRVLAFPLGQSMRYPGDKLDHQLAQTMTKNNHYREQIIKQVYLSGDNRQPVDRMEAALQAIIQHASLYEKVSDLRRYKFGDLKSKLAEKVKNNEITPQEMEELIAVEKLRWDAIQVDEFSFDSMKKRTFASLAGQFKTPLD